MKKSQLIEKAVEAGLDASGTVAQLKERLEAYRPPEKKVVQPEIKGNPARHAYRKSVHMPK